MHNASKIWIWLLLWLAASAALASGKTHQPMLASVYTGKLAIPEYWVSEKLDGVRGHWDGHALWTRGGYTINPPGWFIQGWPDMPMDGELWIGRNTFDKLSAIVRSNKIDDSEWQTVKFMVFDLPGHGGPFNQRVQVMRDITAWQIPWLQPIEQFRVADPQELNLHLQRIIAAGGEGLMLHHQDAIYLPGRSQQLLKYKPYNDAEARVIGYTAGKGKYAGKVGALEVQSPDGRRFRLGSGLTNADRNQPPPIGSWVTYRYNGITVTGLPRFARFVRIRVEVPVQ